MLEATNVSRLYGSLLAGLVALLFVEAAVATDFSKIFRKVDPAVVVIRTVGSESRMGQQGIKHVRSQGLGSGVVVNPEGFILTASHVVNTADTVTVTFANGDIYEAEVVMAIKPADIALLQLIDPPADLPFIPVSDSDKVGIGSEVFVVGAPYGLEHTLTVGHLSGRREMQGEDAILDVEFLQTDAPVNQGNSGGPMFTADGKLIGIVSFILSQSGGSQGLGFAVSTNTAREILLNAPPIWTGMELVPLRGTLAKALNLPTDEGMLVQSVADDSLGAALGVIPSYIPVSIGGKEILIGGDTIINGRRGLSVCEPKGNRTKS